VRVDAAADPVPREASARLSLPRLPAGRSSVGRPRPRPKVTLPPQAAADDGDRPVELLAGFLAAAALAAGAIAVAYRPVRIGVFAIVLALVAAGIGGRFSRLATAAVLLVTAAWVVGMILAVLTENPLW
jgi:hypothetical protein